MDKLGILNEIVNENRNESFNYKTSNSITSSTDNIPKYKNYFNKSDTSMLPLIAAYTVLSNLNFKHFSKYLTILAEMNEESIEEFKYEYLINSFLKWFYSSNKNVDIFIESINYLKLYHKAISDLIVAIARDQYSPISIQNKRNIIFNLIKNKSLLIRLGSIYALNYLLKDSDVHILEKIEQTERNLFLKGLISSQLSRFR